MSKYDLLDKCYDEIPEYIKDNGKNFITINVSDWQGDQTAKITIDDVVEYYKSQAGNIVSGARSIAGIFGDWRNIDALAKEALEYFKAVNMDELKKRAKKAGLEPKF